MPSSVAKFAKDEDGDGKIDLWDSLPDIVSSIANYFAGNGWPGALLNSRFNAPLLASNCQRRFASGAVWRMLQDCQRAM